MKINYLILSEERFDIAPLIRDVLGNATEVDEFGNLKPVEERLKASIFCSK